MEIQLNWKFNQRIQLKDNFTENSTKIKWMRKFNPRILSKDIFTELNKNQMKAENSTR